MTLGAMLSKTDETTDRSGRRVPALGLGARLLLAFVGIAFFSVLAAGAGILAFRVVGDRLEGIHASLPPTLAALEVSRSAERLVATAPALLATDDHAAWAAARSSLDAEEQLLRQRIGELGAAGGLDVRTIITRFVEEFDSLGDVVTARAATAERLAGLRSELFATDEQTARVLAPWNRILDSEIRSLVAAPDSEAATGRRLSSLVDMQDAVRSTRERVSAVVGLLAESSSTEDPDRLPVLAFQLLLSLSGLEEAAARLDPRLQEELAPGIARLRGLAAGSSEIAQARALELRLLERAQGQLDSARALSDQLRAVVESLAADATTGIETVVDEALAVQEVSTLVLIALVLLSMLAAVLIVWLYVGRNIARRLRLLHTRVSAIAAGDFGTPVEVSGTDEVARMGAVVESLRRNTLERDRLELAGRYKSHLLASASHDLRQPLHALNLFIARLRADAAGPERERLVDNINSAAASMTEMFDSLLDMAKLDAGMLQQEVTDFPAQALLDRIEATFGARARTKGLQLRVVASRAWLRSDFVLLERLVFNLVANAVRHTAGGGITVGLRRKGDAVRIDVCDTGPGIAADQLSLVFREHSQLAPADREGLGLGLAIVERLGTLMGHAVDIDSKVGRGSRFSVTVPLAPSGPSIDAPQARSREVRGGRKRVLVIDDDPLAAEATGEIIRSWNHDVSCVASTETALAAIIAGERPDLIIADYRLGRGETGIDAIRSVRRASGKHVAAFLVSGQSDVENVDRAASEDLHLLSKPVSPMRLRAMVEQSLKEVSTTATTG